jgi:hydroxymethylglutaryl-CoA reductase
MALHARNIAVAAGAVGPELDWLVKRLVELRDVRMDLAVDLLAQARR